MHLPRAVRWLRRAHTPLAVPCRVARPTTQAYEEIGHSDNAAKILSKFKIGELPKPVGVFDKLPLVPIACVFAGAAGMLAVRALARRAG